MCIRDRILGDISLFFMGVTPKNTPNSKTMKTIIQVSLIKNEVISLQSASLWILARITPVSYTHLDVYKRQLFSFYSDFLLKCIILPVGLCRNRRLLAFLQNSGFALCKNRLVSAFLQNSDWTLCIYRLVSAFLQNSGFALCIYRQVLAFLQNRS